MKPTLARLLDKQPSLAFVPQCLGKVGYDEKGVCALLNVSDIASLAGGEVPGHSYRCERDGSARAAMTQLWLLGRGVPRSKLDAAFGRRGSEALITRGLVRPAARGKVIPQAAIFPCAGRYFLTDLLFCNYPGRDQVYYLGQDSYALAYLTPRRRVERTLDLCCGSGIHTIMAARHSQVCVGVDRNSRALAFAEANVQMNDCSKNCTFIRTELSRLTGIGRFDLIVTNPPWVPSPDSHLEWFRFGGETGEELTRLAISAARRRLAPGGMLVMFAIFPEMRGTDYLDRLQQWCGRGGRDYGIALARLPETSIESFVASQLSPRWPPRRYEMTFRRWLRSYEKLGIVGLGTGVIFLKRLAQGEPGFVVERPIPWPDAPIPDAVEAWLDALEGMFSRRFDRSWRSWIPTRKPWPDSTNGTRLAGDEAYFASRLDGRTAAGKLAAGLARRFRLSERLALRRTRAALERLVVRGEAT